MKTKILFLLLFIITFLSCAPNDVSKETDMSAAVDLAREFTFDDGCDQDDELFKEIMQQDLRGKSTPLELMQSYANVLNTRTSHGDIDEKLDRLFACGLTPDGMKGFYHGITLSMRTGSDIYGFLEDARERLNIGKEIDILQALYGRVLSTTSPWAGKDFRKMGPEKTREMTGGHDTGSGTSYLGINSFRRENKGFVNNLSNYVLASIIDMEEMPKPDDRRRSWIHSRGGLFIAKREKSVNIEAPDKEVMALNYRWKSLDNQLPNRLLIDEIVEISKGLFLGKLYYATAVTHIFNDYDPNIPNKDYKYRNFGYFLLMDDTWFEEKNRLFPGLAYNLTDNLSGKFRTFRFKESPECAAIQKDMGDSATILHYMQGIYQGIQGMPGYKDRYFARLLEVFNCGERPDGINGFFHGGVVSFKNGGFLEKFDRNVLNDLYPSVRPFSPWTGKTFTLTSREEIKKYIGESAENYEGASPIILGTNTYRKELGLSLPATAFIEHLDRTGMVVEYPDEKEKSDDIYVKSFYFIATNGKSINPDNNGKEVLQFNYRWPEFHTMTPDHLCIDELVRIADGLYIGQLMYSTRPEIKYDPDKDPSLYEYEVFGYFMLMDDEWHAVREFIEFDTD